MHPIMEKLANGKSCWIMEGRGCETRECMAWRFVRSSRLAGQPDELVSEPRDPEVRPCDSAESGICTALPSLAVNVMMPASRGILS